MKNLNESMESITRLIGNLLETQKDIVAIKVVKNSSTAGSVLVLGAIILVLASLVLLFAGLALAWWVGGLTESIIAGLAVAGGFYFLILIAMLGVAKTFLLPTFRNQIIRKIYEDK